MLNFLNHFSVPGVEHVMVYHDDQSTDLFYMVPELPSILRRENRHAVVQPDLLRP